MPVAISSYASQGIPTADYHSKLNSYVMVVSLVAASGGLLFGYDLGVTGQSLSSQMPVVVYTLSGTDSSHIPILYETFVERRIFKEITFY